MGWAAHKLGTHLINLMKEKGRGIMAGMRKIRESNVVEVRKKIKVRRRRRENRRMVSIRNEKDEKGRGRTNKRKECKVTKQEEEEGKTESL